MEALPTRRLSHFFGLAALAILCAPASWALAETGPDVAAGMHSMTRVFSIDKRLPRAMRPVLEEAARKLSDSRCQEILGDFADASGRPLEENLAATGQAMPGYLEWVVFYDGQSSAPCADHETLAWTHPGSRAVHVCGDQFAALARGRTGDAANILIHEALHTLGLGEGPPDAREITARVQSRCGR